MSIEPAASPDQAIRLMAPAPPTRRVDPVDVLRGAVMVLMVLDHTRDYFGNAAIDPLDLSQVSPALFHDTVGHPLLRASFRLPRGDGRLSGGLPRPVAGRPRGVPRFAGGLVNLPRADGRSTRPLFRPRERPGDLDSPVVDRGLVRRSGGAGLPAQPGGRGARGAADRDARPGRRLVTGLRNPRRSAGRRRVLLRPGILPMPDGVSVLVAYPLLPWLGVVAAGYGFGEVIRLEQGAGGG